VIIKIKLSESFAGIGGDRAFKLSRNRKQAPRVTEKSLDVIYFPLPYPYLDLFDKFIFS